MARDPVVFALANPVPEVLPDQVRAVRPDAVVATGRSDYPNQVNNVLGFPFIFRGALDARATTVNEEMKMAATRALALLAREEVPESVSRLYGLQRVRFGRDYLIPFPFDPRILLWVAPAVAWAAVATGVAREFVDLDTYRAQLESRLGRARGIMRGIITRATNDPKRVVFPEGEEPKVLRAAQICADEGIARPVLLGRREVIARTAAEHGVVTDDLEIVDIEDSPRRDDYARYLWGRRQRKGLSLGEAHQRLHNPNYFGCCMLALGEADAVLSGVNATYPETVRPALETVGAHPKAGCCRGCTCWCSTSAWCSAPTRPSTSTPRPSSWRRSRSRPRASCAPSARSRGWRCCRSPTSARCATRRPRRWRGRRGSCARPTRRS
jgi:malate dehydrogenase (oxaloacetate-decarboxylating)(NADP+)